MLATVSQHVANMLASMLATLGRDRGVFCVVIFLPDRDVKHDDADGKKEFSTLKCEVEEKASVELSHHTHTGEANAEIHSPDALRQQRSRRK